MPDIINFVAYTSGYALFDMAENPLARVEEMQESTPAPVDLIGCWIVPPQCRADVLDDVAELLKDRPQQSGWYRITEARAYNTLRQAAEVNGGRAWKARKQRTEAVDNAHHRAVITPRGRFPTAAAAAAWLGISRQAAWERAARRVPGWRFEDDDSPQPAPVRRGRPPKK